MKKLRYLLIFTFLFSCTSNTIFEKPKDLIPMDTMSLLIQELTIASSAKFMKTINKRKNINYMPFVFENFGIDSLRFQNSNLYYMSIIDDYEEILANAKAALEKRKGLLQRIDSLQKDSLNGKKLLLKKLDTVEVFKSKE